MISSNFLGPHHEYLVRLIEHFVLVLILGPLQRPCCEPFVQLLRILASLGVASMGCSAIAGSFDDLGA